MEVEDTVDDSFGAMREAAHTRRWALARRIAFDSGDPDWTKYLDDLEVPPILAEGHLANLRWTPYQWEVEYGHYVLPTVNAPVEGELLVKCYGPERTVEVTLQVTLTQAALLLFAAENRTQPSPPVLVTHTTNHVPEPEPSLCLLIGDIELRAYLISYRPVHKGARR